MAGTRQHGSYSLKVPPKTPLRLDHQAACAPDYRSFPGFEDEREKERKRGNPAVLPQPQRERVWKRRAKAEKHKQKEWTNMNSPFFLPQTSYSLHVIYRLYWELAVNNLADVWVSLYKLRSVLSNKTPVLHGLKKAIFKYFKIYSI